MNRRRSVALASLLLSLSATTASADDFRAWLLADAPLWMQDARPMKKVSDLGIASTECLNCHDGVRATRITATHAIGSGIGSRLRGGNHPVGMDYASAASRHRHGYRPRSTLPQSVVLEDGRVTCLSCHRIEMRRPAASGFTKVAWSSDLRPSPHTSELTVGPQTSDLCLACHEM